MKQAFTLIELLVVVLIIGILSGIALPQYQKAVAKTRFTQLQIWGRSLLDAQKVYFLANSRYATTFDELDIQLPGSLSTDKRTLTFNNMQCFFNGDYLEIACRHTGNESFQGNIPELLLSYGSAYIICRAWSEKEKSVCLAMGGEYRTTDDNYTDYYLYKEN